MSKLLKRLLALAVVAALGVGTANALGTFPGYPLWNASPTNSNTNPLTGSETIPADTNLTQGINPQTELITTSALAMYSAGASITHANASNSLTAGTVTINARAGKVNTSALTTANNANYSLTVTNSLVNAQSIILASVGDGGNTTVGAVVLNVTPGAGSFVIQIGNRSSSAALNGSVRISFFVLQ